MSKQRISGIIKHFKGVFLSFVLFAVLIIIWTIITYFFNIPNKIISVVAYAIMSVCIVISGLSSSYRSEGNGWLNGLIGGVVFIALLLITALIILGGNLNIVNFLKKVPLFVVMSLIGGIIGINLK